MFWFVGPEACGILSTPPGIEPAPHALEGEVLTTGPPGKSLIGTVFNSEVQNPVLSDYAVIFLTARCWIVCLCPKFRWWNLKPQSCRLTVFRNRTFEEVIKLKCVCCNRPQSSGGLDLYKERKLTHRKTHKHSQGCMKTQGEDSCLQARERGLRRNWTCPHLDPRFPAFRTVGNFYCWSPQIWGVLLEGP